MKGGLVLVQSLPEPKKKKWHTDSILEKVSSSQNQ